MKSLCPTVMPSSTISGSVKCARNALYVAPVALHALGGALLACRLLHAWGLGCHRGANHPRLIGAQGTFLLMSIMGVALLYGAWR